MLSIATILLGMVTYIIDGDTLDVTDRFGNKERIRIHGVDTPEMNTKAGKEARAFMRRWAIGKQVACSPPKGYSYNRVVRTCCIGNQDIAAALVNLDMAVSVPKYDTEGIYSRPNGEYVVHGCPVR